MTGTAGHALWGTGMVIGMAGAQTDLPWVQYGALGVLALALVLAYRLTMAQLAGFKQTMEVMQRDCHNWSQGRETRLVAALEESRREHLVLIAKVLDKLGRV